MYRCVIIIIIIIICYILYQIYHYQIYHYRNLYVLEQSNIHDISCATKFYSTSEHNAIPDIAIKVHLFECVHFQQCIVAQGLPEAVVAANGKVTCVGNIVCRTLPKLMIM